MSKENKAVELNDEELKEVSGGKTEGSIEYVKYDSIKTSQYYATEDKATHIYLYHVGETACSYNYATVTYDGTYWSRSIDNHTCGSCGRDVFTKKYCYNVVFH